MVSYDWLVDSLEQRTKLDEGSYIIGGSTVQPRPRAKKNEPSKKRAQNDLSARQGDNDRVATSEPPAKRHKDGQKASSLSIFIPLDDCVVQQLGSKYQ